MKSTILLLFCAFQVGAANLYVRDGGSGSGTSWSDAYDQLSSAETAASRGDTIYVADGTYSAVTFNTAVSGTSLITIKKATVADHGTDTGWSDTYGDGQGELTGPLRFTTDYWVLDGVSRGGWRTNYGFKINNNNGSNVPNGTTAAIHAGDSTLGSLGNTSHILLKYLEVAGSRDVTGTYSDDGILFTRTSGQCVSNTVQYCWIHDVGALPIEILNPTGFTVEYSWLQNNQSTAASHSEGIGVKASSTNIVLRFSYFENIEGTADIASPSGGSGYNYENWAIYGNVFFKNLGETNGVHSEGNGGSGDGILSLFNHTSFTGFLRIYNNTVYDWDNPTDSGRPQWNYNANADAIAFNEVSIANNLWYSCTRSQSETSTALTGSTISTFVHDYNAYIDSNHSNDSSSNKITGTGDPFVGVSQSAGAVDFRLVGSVGAGTALSAPYDTDMNGNTRGADGTWDVGAFEYAPSVNPNTPRVHGGLRNLRGF